MSKIITGPVIKNRIVEIREMRLGDVLAHPDNPKLHPDRQRKALRAEVKALGWAGVPMAYYSERQAGALTWCDGHMRASEFPDLVAMVAITDYTDSEVDQLLPVYDFIGTMSKALKDSAEALINRTPVKSLDLATVQASYAEQANLGIPTLSTVHAAAGQAPDRKESPIGRVIKAPKWNKKRDALFLSFRSWRRSSQRADLEAFKEAKANCPEDVINDIAQEMTTRLLLTLRNPAAAGAWVTSPPRGHSKEGKHFAAELARRVAELMGLPYYPAFVDRVLPSSSSPATYHQRQVVYLNLDSGMPESGLVLIVDDIATSGTTLESCQNALGAAGYATLATAWLCEITEEF